MSKFFVTRAGETRFPQLPANLYRVIADAESTHGKISFLEVQVMQDLPRHIHQVDDESALLLEGEMEFTCGDEKHLVGPGDYIYLPAKIPHSVRRASKTNPRLLSIGSPGGFEHAALAFSQAFAAGVKPDSDEFKQLAKRHGFEFL